MSKAGPTAVFLIGLAVKMKALATKQYRYTPLFNLLLKKFKQTTGGQLQLCVSGGGAVSSQGTGACEWLARRTNGRDCDLRRNLGRGTGVGPDRARRAARAGLRPDESLEERIEWSQMDELVSGYGLTETTGGTTVQKYNDLSIGIAGTPMATMEAAGLTPERGRAPRLTRG